MSSEKDTLTNEVVTDDNKTSRLEAIIKLGKGLSSGLFIVWTSLAGYGAIIAPALELEGTQALAMADTIFPVTASVITLVVGVLIGKEVAK